MTYLFAVIGVIAVCYLLWRAFGPAAHDDRPDSASRRRSPGPRGPDDDAAFLRDLDRRTRGPNGSDSDDA